MSEEYVSGFGDVSATLKFSPVDGVYTYSWFNPATWVREKTPVEIPTIVVVDPLTRLHGVQKTGDSLWDTRLVPVGQPVPLPPDALFKTCLGLLVLHQDHG